MSLFIDQVANFDPVSRETLARLYEQAAATDPMPLSFNGWLLLQVMLFQMSHPGQYSRGDVHKNPGPFISWLEERTVTPKP
jgi:hypothetical protein